MTRTLNIDGRFIGPGHPPYIIAEMSGNHNGDIDRALDLVERAKAAGADAIKLQTYTADTLTIDHKSDDFMIRGGLWDGYSLYELYREAHTPWDWHKPLFDKAREIGITLFSTPFDETAVDFLEDLGIQAYKVASFEAMDPTLIKKIAATGKPLIVSTGMASLDEIEQLVFTARLHGCKDPVLLHCVSAYPAPADACNLETLVDIAKRFDVISGLSDHTLGTVAAVTAVALGASVVEKHFTLSRAEGGVDSAFSLEFEEFCSLTRDCRIAYESRGKINYDRPDCEKDSLVFRRSLYIVKDIFEGEVLTRENVRAIRPGYGMSPKYLDDVLGRPVKRSLSRGTRLIQDDIDFD